MCVRKFLHVRVTKDGRTLDSLFECPELADSQWFRTPWHLGHGLAEEQRFALEGWQQAWRGTNMEAIFHDFLLSALGKQVG